MASMRKKVSSKIKKKVSYQANIKVKSIVQEPVEIYQSNHLPIPLKDFTFNRFKKIYEMAPFTFKEWANFLHLSERTLLRYSKENKHFEGIYTERMLMLESLFYKGQEVFSDPDKFFSWLRKPKSILGRTFDENALTTTAGILALEEELGRIEHGVYI